MGQDFLDKQYHDIVQVPAPGDGPHGQAGAAARRPGHQSQGRTTASPLSLDRNLEPIYKGLALAGEKVTLLSIISNDRVGTEI